MAWESHLYLVVHPNHSLVASQLDAERFIKHYMRESTRYFEGKLVFVELDRDFRDPYFDVEGAYAQLKPHEDGSPKATKFISSYRVLEHVSFEAMGRLYICDASGGYVVLEPAPEGTPDGAVIAPSVDELRVILEVDPVKFIVLTRLGLTEYARFATDPANSKGAPRMLYTQLDLSVDDFIRETEESPYVTSFFPGIHPERLRAAIRELRRSPSKDVKGLSLYCPLDRISYKLLRGGFVFASPERFRFYPLLSLDEVERKYYKFWKSM
ncbi:MAG: hypothetical protein ABSF43_09240 [Rectinemataceae bacterium]